ncbi:putative quinol monooxygenase [Desulfatitalea tepidiphila]|uniref:putative quinol monooxygenase n=1 Tax=Desulfatitalea tepidiphila TaxID=1185843 RepID=UPI0006B61CB0|nr:antibiotic biosynthesis monooxygenase [Desulfatitalea tepidiphila]
MVRMTVVARVRPEKRGELLDAMRSLQRDRLLERGICASRVYECKEDTTHLVLIDEWEKEENLRSYTDKEGFRVLLGALRTLCAEADVKYDAINDRGDGLRLYGFDGFTDNKQTN